MRFVLRWCVLELAQANLGIGLLYRVDNGDGRKWTITGSGGS